MKKLLISVSVVMLFVLMVGCAPGEEIELDPGDSTLRLNTPSANPLMNEPAENGRVAGLLQGLWHGIIAPVTLIMSFFNESVQMYEVHNNGNAYNLGYLLGVAVVFLLLGISGRRRR